MNRKLNLPSWGPYSRHYMGMSKIVADQTDRQMIDFVFVPGYMRGRIVIPDVNFDCGYHPWTSVPDFSYYAIRYDLQDKEREYCHAEYFPTDKGCLVKLNFVNKTASDKEYSATCFAVQRLHESVHLEMLAGEYWIDAENYTSLDYKPPLNMLDKGENYETFCHLNYLNMGHDGLRRGVTVEENLVHSAGLGNRKVDSGNTYLAIERNRTFLMNNGTEIVWKADGKRHRYVWMRCSMDGISKINLKLAQGDYVYPFSLCGEDMVGSEDCPVLVRLELDESQNADELRLRAEESDTDEAKGFLIDGFLLTDEECAEKIYARFILPKGSPRFNIHRFAGKKGAALTTERLPNVTIALYSPSERPVPPPPYSDCSITNVYNNDLSGSRVLRKLNNDSLLNWGIHNCQIYGDMQNHFAGYHAAPVVCRAGEIKTVYIALVCDEDGCRPEEAAARAEALYSCRESIEQRAKEIHAQQMLDVKNRVWDNDYGFSQERLMCNLLTNVTFPVYIKDGFYRTYTPGKRWGGLFTWDSGILGIGLTEYAPENAAEILAQYFADEDDRDIDAVLHGTQLPLHIYLLFHLYQRTGDRELLRRFYPSARKYYRYFAGISELSSYDKFRSGLLCPFEDGYNVEGIDDYPPQHYAGLEGVYDRISPVCTSAHAIRTGKLLALMALEAGFEQDIPEIQRWNDYLSEALHRDAWDEKNGYFSYVWNEPRSKLYYDKDEQINYNMGIDGVSPLLSGILSENQLLRIREHLMTEGQMWTPYGITSVDMSAPYARVDGYWNGKVWIPHQWFFYKALITEGEPQDAIRIAQTALDVWKHSVEDTYNCYEQFCTMTGMGEGCHNFGGLSAPMAAFYFDLLEKNRITCGFDSFVRDVQMNDDVLEFVLFTPHRVGKTGALVSVGKPGMYQVEFGGQIQQVETIGHVLPLCIADAHGEVHIKIKKA